jgi:RNA polymerase sigma-70 factor (ECF subfamily)
MDMTAQQLTDETAFAEAVERHRRELQVHCYRMLGSFEESEDLTQETFLRAWRRRETYEARASVRAWLYRIATNACLDALERRPRTPSPDGEIPWLQPFPDELLEGIAADEDEPDAEIVARETIELAFMVAIQHLPPRPRAVLIMRDILGWRAKETAALLGVTTAAVNSALQRARAGLKEHLPEHRLEWNAQGSAEERALVARYIETTETADVDALAALIHEDAAFWMPPEPGLYVGRDTMISAWVQGGFGDVERIGHFKLLETRANRQPALANYVRQPGAERYLPLAIDVLRIEGGAITEIIAFGAPMFPAFGLPPEL